MGKTFPGLTAAYVGPNPAHLRFRTAIANAKTLGYVLASEDAKVLRSFLDAAETVRSKSPDGTFAIGVAGGGSRTTMQLGIHITGSEIDLIAGEPGGFVSQALGLVYREAYRIFETFVIDLFEEIALRDRRILFSGHTITHEDALRPGTPLELQRLIIARRKTELTRVGLGKLEKLFRGFGLPIVPMVEPPPIAQQQGIQRRLHLLSASRNVIEHNRSEVNDEFIALVPDSKYSVGDRITITTSELGEALSAVEWTADQLNVRALARSEVA
jgi:hypothetical protein